MNNSSKNIVFFVGARANSKGKKTNIILKRENCPRIITKENYNLNVMKIKNLSSKKSFEVLLKFEKQFIKIKKKLI